jgi:death on curing protein
MRYLVVEEVLKLHRRFIEQTGGSLGVRDKGALASVVAPLSQMTFGGAEMIYTHQWLRKFPPWVFHWQ